jgi:hypothetical protein
MRVALLPAAAGPFFLEDMAHQQVMSWVKGHPSDAAADHKLLVLMGPIKSGKTAMLRKVLPGALAAQHAVEGGAKPVFFPFAFTLGQGPHGAALKLVEAAAAKAKALGFELINVPTDGVLALIGLPRIMSNLATGIAAAGGELVLLIDEAQVRAGAEQQLGGGRGGRACAVFAVLWRLHMFSCLRLQLNANCGLQLRMSLLTCLCDAGPHHRRPGA